MSKQAVDQYIQDNAVMMFSKSYCPYCKKAKGILDDAIRGKYKVLDMDTDLDDATMNSYQDTLKDMTGARSVPRVFIQGKSIGGADDVTKLQQSGELNKMLQQAGLL